MLIIKSVNLADRTVVESAANANESSRAVASGVAPASVLRSRDPPKTSGCHSRLTLATRDSGSVSSSRCQPLSLLIVCYEPGRC